MIYEFFCRSNAGVITNYLCGLMPHSRLIDVNIADSKTSGFSKEVKDKLISYKRFIYGCEGNIYCVEISSENEVRIYAYKDTFGPLTGKLHHHINVYGTQTAIDLKIFLNETFRDLRIKSIL